MGGGARGSLERARRDIAGYAEDGLPWEQFGTVVTEAAARVIPFDAAVISMVDPTTGLLTNIVRTGIDDTRDELFMRIELTRPDPLTLTALADQPDGVGILADHVGSDPHSSPRVRELLAPHFDLEHEMRGVVRSGGSMVAASGLYRARTRPGFSAEEASSLAALEEVVAAGLRRILLASPREPVRQAAGPAVVVVDAGGRVREMTVAAESRLRSRHGSPGGPGGLAASVRMVAEASRVRHAGHDIVPRARVRDEDGRWFLVEAAPLRNGARSGRTAVTIQPAAPEEMLDLELGMYELTPRERAVIREVLAGASTSRIAADLGISVYTVQDHLKAIFAKTGVSSRRELVASLAQRRPR